MLFFAPTLAHFPSERLAGRANFPTESGQEATPRGASGGKVLLTSFTISMPFCDLSISGHLRPDRIWQQFQYALGGLDG